MKLSRALFATALVAVATNAVAQDNAGREEGSSAPTQPPPPVYVPPGPYGQQPAPYGQPAYGSPYAPPPYVQGPKKMAYGEGDPIPAGYHVVTGKRTGLLIAGGIVFGVFYGFTVAGAGGSDDPDAKWLYAPVVGPVLYGNTLHGELAGVSRFFLWIDALAQAGGAAMLIGGFVPKKELVRNDVATVHVQPVVAPGVSGVSLGGVF